jgi:hypothetical protein
MRRALFLAIAIFVVHALSVGGIPNANAATPCCGITAIDARTGIVTARDTVSQRTFQFKVPDARLLRTLRVGQKIFADFTARTVTLAANQRPCCSIIEAGAAAPAASSPLPAPGSGTKSVSTNYSVLSPDVATLAVRPQLYLPDLVPHAGSYLSVCTWNESEGETCESECPPVTLHIPLGTRNISNRPLTGPVTISVFDHPSGVKLHQWSATNVPGAGINTPGWYAKTIVRCHPPGQTTISDPPAPNRRLMVETEATEADQNNNATLVYLDPSAPLGP